MEITIRHKDNSDNEIERVCADTIQPLVNPTMDEAKTFKFDRSVVFDDVKYSIQWLEEAMNSED